MHARGTSWGDHTARTREFQDKHQRIVRRWGRYPHRNAVLGRSMGSDEESWLREHGGF